jgi:hypothetical protein
MQPYVYVGVSARTGGTTSGLHRRAVDDAKWERLIGGLPDNAHVHAITDHRRPHEIQAAPALRGPARVARWSPRRSGRRALSKRHRGQPPRPFGLAAQRHVGLRAR